MYTNYDRKYKSAVFSSLGYYSKKALKKIYPDKGYVIVGAIGEGLSSNPHKFICNDEDQIYYSLKYNRFKYEINGYIDCGDHELIAVVRSKLSRHLLLLLLILALIAGTLFTSYLLIKDKIMLDPNIGDYTSKVELLDNADPNSIAIPGYTELRMLANTDEVYAALWNPETNPCYFKFTIELQDESKIIYESGLVPPGKVITTVKLNQTMKEGE